MFAAFKRSVTDSYNYLSSSGLSSSDSALPSSPSSSPKDKSFIPEKSKSQVNLEQFIWDFLETKSTQVDDLIKFQYFPLVIQFYNEHKDELGKKTNDVLNAVLLKTEGNIEKLCQIRNLLRNLVSEEKDTNLTKEIFAVHTEFINNPSLDNAATSALSTLITTANDISIPQEGITFETISVLAEKVKKISDQQNQITLTLSTNHLSQMKLDQVLRVSTTNLITTLLVELNKCVSKELFLFEEHKIRISNEIIHHEDTLDFTVVPSLYTSESLATEIVLANTAFNNLKTTIGSQPQAEALKTLCGKIETDLSNLDRMIKTDLLAEKAKKVQTDYNKAEIEILKLNFSAEEFKNKITTFLLGTEEQKRIAQCFPQCAVTILIEKLNELLTSKEIELSELIIFNGKVTAFISAIQDMSKRFSHVVSAEQLGLDEQIKQAMKLATLLSRRIQEQPNIESLLDEFLIEFPQNLELAQQHDNLVELFNLETLLQEQMNAVNQWLEDDAVKHMERINQSKTIFTNYFDSLKTYKERFFGNLMLNIQAFQLFKSQEEIKRPVFYYQNSEHPTADSEKIKQQHQQLHQLKECKGIFESKMVQLDNAIKTKINALNNYSNSKLNIPEELITSIKKDILDCQNIKAKLASEQKDNLVLINQLEKHLQIQTTLNHNFNHHKTNLLRDASFVNHYHSILITKNKTMNELVCNDQDSENAITQKIQDTQARMQSVATHIDEIKKYKMLSKQISIPTTPISATLNAAFKNYNDQVVTSHQQAAAMVPAYESMLNRVCTQYTKNINQAFFQTSLNNKQYLQFDGECFKRIKGLILKDPYFVQITNRASRIDVSTTEGQAKKNSINTFNLAVRGSQNLEQLLRLVSPQHLNNVPEMDKGDTSAMDTLRKRRPKHIFSLYPLLRYKSKTDNLLHSLEKHVKKYIQQEWEKEQSKIKSPKNVAIVNLNKATLFLPDGSINRELKYKLQYEYDEIIFIHESDPPPHAEALQAIQADLMRHATVRMCHTSDDQQQLSTTQANDLLQIYHQMALSISADNAQAGQVFNLSIFEEALQLTDDSGSIVLNEKPELGQVYLIHASPDLNTIKKKTVCIKLEDYPQVTKIRENTELGAKASAKALERIDSYQELTPALIKFVNIQKAKQTHKSTHKDAFFKAPKSNTQFNIAAANKLRGLHQHSTQNFSPAEMEAYHQCRRLKRISKYYSAKLPRSFREALKLTTHHKGPYTPLTCKR